MDHYKQVSEQVAHEKLENARKKLEIEQKLQFENGLKAEKVNQLKLKEKESSDSEARLKLKQEQEEKAKLGKYIETVLSESWMKDNKYKRPVDKYFDLVFQ